GLKPALPNISDSAIAKQAAWAAPSSSSGLVPAPSSKREANEYAALNAPFPKSTCPLPSLRLPSQRACALRVGMTAPFQTSRVRGLVPGFISVACEFLRPDIIVIDAGFVQHHAETRNHLRWTGNVINRSCWIA